jgi:ubiquinone/menaquinone biosynthesis C-methylase UbiE
MTEGHFDPEGAPYLDTDERIKELRPYRLLQEKAGIKPGMTCIDLGSGTGTFSFPLLLCVGAEGIVYAVDDSGEMLEHIREKNPPPNLILVHGDVSRTGLDSEIADLCMLSSILHEVEQPASLLAEALRLLKPGGRILAIDWKVELDSPGPPQRLRLSQAKVEQLFKQSGFHNFQYLDWSRNYYIALGNKKSADRAI